MKKRSRYFLAALVAAAVYSWCTAAHAAQPARAEIRFLTYNVAGIPVTHGRVRARTERMAAILKERLYDIASFQECWYSQCAQTLGQRFENRVRTLEGIFRGNGLMLGSRFPVLDISSFTYALNAPLHRFLYGEADGVAAKGVIAAELQTPAGPLKVFDTHMIAGYPFRDYVPERIAQVYELARFVRHYAGTEPYAILGDMNFNPASREYALLVSLLGLRDACPQCAPTDEGGGLIDHIFLSPAMEQWTVATATVTFDGFLDAAKNIPLSDHKAVELVLAPPRPGAARRTAQRSPMTRREALLAVVREMDGYIRSTSSAIRENLFIPVYGWAHAYWALGQIEAARRLQAEALGELAAENALVRRVPAAGKEG